MSDDKRGQERITINKEFESFDAFIQEYITNISKTGVFVRIGAKNANLAAHDIAPVYDTSGYLAAELTL